MTLLTWKYLRLLYDGKKDVQAAEQMPIECRKCICKHPIEWDVSIIEKLYDAKQEKTFEDSLDIGELVLKMK